MLIACIVAGIAVGPALSGSVSAHTRIDLLAQVGVAVLLFAVGLVTITASTCMILYARPLHERLAPWLRIFERRRPFRAAGGAPAGRTARARRRLRSRGGRPARGKGHGGDLAIVARDAAAGVALQRAGAPIVLDPVRDAVDYAVEHLAEPMRAARPAVDPEAS